MERAERGDSGAGGMKMRQQLPPPRCIAIDVDGTLISREGALNERLAEWAGEKKAAGWEVVLWSMRGSRYARAVADRHGIAENFTAILSKPGHVVDDEGWAWTRRCRVLRELF